MEAFSSKKTKSFVNNPFFRIISPLATGILVYFLVLLVFNTLDQFETNFFRAELILCLLISYFIFGFNRLLIIVLEKVFPKEIVLTKRIVFQMLAGTVLIFIITSIFVGLYMSKLVGFNSYNSELLIFNAFYVTIGWCYHAVYFSMIYQKKVADISFENEKLRKQTIEIQMETSLNHLKPDFLNKCLETLIALTYKSPELAEEYLEKVSDFYRVMLSHSQKEPVNLDEELKNANNYIAINNYWLGSSIIINDKIDKQRNSFKILPGAIQIVYEYIVKNAILLPEAPVEINIGIEDLFIEINCGMYSRLNINEINGREINTLRNSYTLFTEKELKINNVNGSFSVRIPLLMNE